MAFNLILNSSNVIGNNKTIYRYEFSGSGFTINEESEMCVASIVIPYSWFNLNLGLYNNVKLQYTWPSASGGAPTTYTITFPNGYYSVSDLQNSLEQFMISENQYLYNSTTGNNYYFLSIVSNATYYANQILTFPVPSSSSSSIFPAGYTAPSGFVYSPSQYTPQFIFPSSGGINTIVGFEAGSYPTSYTNTASYNALSNTTPNATPVNSVIVQCDLVNNECGFPSTILDSFSPNASFGSNIVFSPSYEKWIKIQPGTYGNLNIFFTDQNFNPIQANDSNVLISLLLKQGKKKNVEPSVAIKPKPFIRSLKFRDDEEGDE